MSLGLELVDLFLACVHIEQHRVLFSLLSILLVRDYGRPNHLAQPLVLWELGMK
jgi:hypothetical protein